ncbi:MAG: dimethylarginine dimethylaminohydrolase [Gammaproteobacteria bacterium]|nr:dimethylarginine dimethylaminohydrolase [Gammaproteobacteria bacterium]
MTFRFDAALMRAPGRSVTSGLRAVDRGAPSFEALCDEHARYRAALQAAGVEVAVLPALEPFPDSVFMEDPALVFTEGAIVLRPGAPSRRGEAEALRPALESRFARVLTLADGHADGGDVLVTPRCVYIGLSARTDRAGAAALLRALAEFGKAAEIVEPPAGVLHLKTACSLLDQDRLLVTRELAGLPAFAGFERLVLPSGEEAAANALRVNDVLLLSAGHPRTADMLVAAGLRVEALPTGQVALLDAGLSCLSLRWLRGAGRAT